MQDFAWYLKIDTFCSRVNILNSTAPLCGVIPYLSHGTVYRRNSLLLYTCIDGWRFEDGTRDVNVTCGEAPNVIGRPPIECLGRSGYSLLT